MRAFIVALLAATTLASDSVGAYNYLKGGEDWVTVYESKANNLCGLATSKEQSPIDLQDGTSSETIKMTLTGVGSQAKPAIANGSQHETNWQHLLAGAEWYADAKLTRTDNAGVSKSFQPQQYHFHTPSEHTVEGTSYQAEMHLVTSHPTNGLAVLGVFFDSSAGTDENEFLKSFFAGIADRDNSNAEEQAKIDMTKLFSSSLDTANVWMYDGSFTTPPCTEGVKWTVLQQVQNISASQLAQFAKYTKGTATGDDAALTTQDNMDHVKTNTANASSAAGNNRKIQPLNARTIYSHLSHAHDGASSLMASAAAIAALTVFAF